MLWEIGELQPSLSGVAEGSSGLFLDISLEDCLLGVDLLSLQSMLIISKSSASMGEERKWLSTERDL